MVAREIMRTVIPVVHPGDSLLTAFELMQKHNLASLPVQDEQGGLVGIVAEGDLLRCVLPAYADSVGHLDFLPPSYRFHGFDADHLHAGTVGEIMTAKGLYAVDPETPVAEVARIMLRERLRALPVIESGRLVGLVTRTELVCTILAPQLRCDRRP